MTHTLWTDPYTLIPGDQSAFSSYTTVCLLIYLLCQGQPARQARAWCN